MDWEITVEEFTEAGRLVPNGKIRWTDEGPAGWPLHWSMEDRDAPPQQSVSANIYVEEQTGRVVIDLVALGVRSGILCKSRFAYLLFVRDWLDKLVDLKPEQRSQRPPRESELLCH
jgi:hypothetical protein